MSASVAFDEGGVEGGTVLSFFFNHQLFNAAFSFTAVLEDFFRCA